MVSSVFTNACPSVPSSPHLLATPPNHPLCRSGGGGSDGVFVSRKLVSTEYGRPLLHSWQGSLGLSWQQACCVDDHGAPLPTDLYGAPLTFSGRRHDTMALGTIRVAYRCGGWGGGWGCVSVGRGVGGCKERGGGTAAAAAAAGLV